MSKLFFNGGSNPVKDHTGYGYQNRGTARPGSEGAPLSLRVGSDARKDEIEALLMEHDYFAYVDVDAEQDEDISELDVLLNKPSTVIVEKTPSRNDPCSCGSGKKYKKCCG